MINLATCMFYISHLLCFGFSARHLVPDNVAHISADKPTDVQVLSFLLFFFILPFGGPIESDFLSIYHGTEIWLWPLF